MGGSLLEVESIFRFGEIYRCSLPSLSFFEMRDNPKVLLLIIQHRKISMSAYCFSLVSI